MSDTAIATPAATSTPASESAPVETSTVETPIQTTATSTPAEPSLADNIAQALRELDGDEQPAAEPEPTATESLTETDEDKFNLENELEQGFHKKRDNRIPHKRVKEMVEKAQKRMTEELTKAHTAALNEREGKIATFNQEIEKVRATEQLMTSDPARFLSGLAQVHPLYGQLLRPLLEKGSVAVDGGVDTSMPQPDYDLGNGQFTYSQEGLAKRMAWERAQAVQEAEGRIMQQIQPLLEKHKASEVDQRLAQHHDQLRQHIQQLSDTLPGFAENWEEIKKTFHGDQNIRSLEHAYDRFMAAKNHTDRNKMREELLAEMKSLPKSTSVSPQAPARRPEEGSDLEARIAAAIKDLDR